MNQFKKAKRYISEGAKVCHMDEDTAVVSSMQKIELKEKKGSVKLWEVDSNNRNGDGDSSDESNIDDSSDSLRPIEIIHAQLTRHTCSTSLSFVCFLRPATLVCFLALIYSFSSSLFCQTSCKKNQATETFNLSLHLWHLEHIVKHFAVPGLTGSVIWEPSWRRLWAEFVCKAEDFLT